MVKSRMTSIDICAIVHGISKDIKSQKLINIYDINNRTYLFKFGGEEKKFLLVESGIRLHTTHWKRENEQKTSVSSISFFNSKLRRYIRNKRLEDISQMGMDRIVKLTFGFGDNTFYLILEFFVAGNIILTDRDYKILVILRDTNDLSIGKYYLWKDYDVVLSPRSLLSQSKPPVSKTATDPLQWLNVWKNCNYMKEELRNILNELENRDSNKEEVELTQKKRKQAQKCNSGITILDVFSRVLKTFHLSIIEKLLESENIAGNEQFTSPMIDEMSEKFIKCIHKASDALTCILNYNYKGILIVEVPSEKEILQNDTILQNQVPNIEKHDNSSKENVYISYSPYVEGHSWISAAQTIPKEGIIISRVLDSFCECVDEFYSSIDIVKETKIVNQEQKTIYSKVDKVKIDQERRLEGLYSEKEACITRAKFMESHQETLEKILQLIRHLIATGAQWQDIWNEIQQQKKNNHPLAKFIKSLHLEDDKVKVTFSQADLNSESISGIDQIEKGIEFELFISKSIQSNIRSQYLQGKALSEKLDKTQNAYKIALKKVTNIANKDAEKVSKGFTPNAPKIKKLRVQYWFEKFHWFISSDGFLIIGGHDASQNELLFRRYLEKNDRYIHADIHGATTCIVKNPSNLPEIPLNTLCEAGQMSICYSKAWINKTVISAWWVYPDQVSKTAPSGEYLTTGSFVIRGKKNFLPPLKLEMGCALYFIKNKQSLKEVDDNEDDKMILPSTQSSINPETSLVEDFSQADSEKMSKLQTQSDSGDDSDEESGSESDSFEKAREKHSNSAHVRFSVGDISDIIPPLKIEHRVQFDELPPELLLSRPFNPLSIDEASNQTSSVNSVESLCHLASKVSIDSSSSESESGNIKIKEFNINISSADEKNYLHTETKPQNHLSTPRNSSRRSSVDEGPPPLGFSASTLPTPAELLSHRVEFPVVLSSSSSEEILDGTDSAIKVVNSETGNSKGTSNIEHNIDLMKAIDSSPSQRNLDTGSATKDVFTHDEFNSKLRENYRRRSIDGGPTPRGFIPDHVPSARELLQKIRFDPVDLELEHLSHMRERGRFISDAVPYLPEELQRLIMVSNQNSNKKHRFTIDTNAGLLSRNEYKHLSSLDLSKEIPGNKNSDKKTEPIEPSTEMLPKTITEVTPTKNEPEKSNDSTSKKPKNIQLPRGKKSKLKKVADKYGDQDDEERKIKMMLFGSKEMKGANGSNPSYQTKNSGKSEEDNQKKPLHISQQEKRRKEQEKMEKVYKNRTVDNTIENREFQRFKDCLLSTNKDDDSDIIAVIPIFAPFACVKDFKYCARLTPGGVVKRSKAAQDIMNHFSNASYKEKDQKSNSYEHIKALKINDMIKNLMNPVKVQFSNEKEKPQVDVRNDRS